MRRSNLRAAAILATSAAEGTVDIVRDTHLAISARAFRSVGPLGAPARVVHDGVAGTVYRTLRLAATLAGSAVRLGTPDGVDVIPSPRPLGALNAAVGDRLVDSGNDLALKMAVRVEGQDIGMTRPELMSAFPAASGRVAFFIHGLGEIETDWGRPRHPAGGSYASELEEALGLTAVAIRYNSGLHVSTNAAHLSRLIGELVAAWPVKVRSISLIGHSMGGLIARGACHRATLENAYWVKRVRHIVSLGTPHHGAPLEKAANVAGWILGVFPETRALARIVNVRSAGVKDLRYGSVTEADWMDRDPDELLRDNREGIPFLEGAAHYYIGATLTRDVDHPAGRLVGDLLVRGRSASGSTGGGRHLPFELENGRMLGGLDHFDLLNHPDVGGQLLQWLR